MDKPWNWGGTKTHEAIINFNFSIKGATLKATPSKHLVFLSLKIISTSPCFYEYLLCGFHARNRSRRDFRKHPSTSKPAEHRIPNLVSKRVTSKKKKDDQPDKNIEKGGKCVFTWNNKCVIPLLVSYPLLLESSNNLLGLEEYCIYDVQPSLAADHY